MEVCREARCLQEEGQDICICTMIFMVQALAQVLGLCLLEGWIHMTNIMDVVCLPIPTLAIFVEGVEASMAGRGLTVEAHHHAIVGEMILVTGTMTAEVVKEGEEAIVAADLEVTVVVETAEEIEIEGTEKVGAIVAEAEAQAQVGAHLATVEVVAGV